MIAHSQNFIEVCKSVKQPDLSEYSAVATALCHYPRQYVRNVIRERGRIVSITFVDDTGVRVQPDLLAQCKHGRRTSRRAM